MMAIQSSHTEGFHFDKWDQVLPADIRLLATQTATEKKPGLPVSGDPTLKLVAMHHRPELQEACAQLINSEWPRSIGARLAQLRSSSDSLPTSLLLVKSDLLVLGHLKLSPVPSDRSCCFVESVVVAKECRGQGFGTLLMRHAELLCVRELGLECIYLSTVDQQRFYSKLGYVECEPISIYGNANFRRSNSVAGKKVYMKKCLLS